MHSNIICLSTNIEDYNNRPDYDAIDAIGADYVAEDRPQDIERVLNCIFGKGNYTFDRSAADPGNHVHGIVTITKQQLDKAVDDEWNEIAEDMKNVNKRAWHSIYKIREHFDPRLQTPPILFDNEYKVKTTLYADLDPRAAEHRLFVYGCYDYHF